MTLCKTDLNPVFPFSIVSFADYVEELGHPYMWVQTLGGLHFPNDTSEVGLGCPILSQKSTSLYVLQPYCARLTSFVPSGCAWGQFTECQSNGEHHEASEGTSPVPPGFDQTVCLFRYVGCYCPQCLKTLTENILSDIVFAHVSEHSIIPVSSECQHLFPAKIMSHLARWTPITYEEYKVYSHKDTCMDRCNYFLSSCTTS